MSLSTESALPSAIVPRTETRVWRVQPGELKPQTTQLSIAAVHRSLVLHRASERWFHGGSRDALALPPRCPSGYQQRGVCRGFAQTYSTQMLFLPGMFPIPTARINSQFLNASSVLLTHYQFLGTCSDPPGYPSPEAWANRPTVYKSRYLRQDADTVPHVQ